MKHAEVIKAMAEDLPVQYKKPSNPQWNTWFDGCGANPISFPELEWRISPPQWQEKLRQAVRDGKKVQVWMLNNWKMSDLNIIPEIYEFKGCSEHDYRIVPPADVVKKCVVHINEVDKPHIWHRVSCANVTFDGTTGKYKFMDVVSS